MEIKFNVTKEERKAFITAISELTGWAAVYKGAPSFAYAVNNYIIDKNGILIYDGRTSAEDVQILLTELAERGFTFEGDINEVAPVVSTPSKIITHSDISGDEMYVGASASVPASDARQFDL